MSYTTQTPLGQTWWKRCRACTKPLLSLKERRSGRCEDCEQPETSKAARATPLEIEDRRLRRERTIAR